MRLRALAGLWLGLAAASAAHAQTLQPASTARSQRDQAIDVFVGGNVKDVLGQPEGSSTISGSLGLRYRGDTYVVNGLINIAGTADTIREGHGGTLLQPAAGKALNAGLLDVRSPRLWLLKQRCRGRGAEIPCHFGLHFYASASSATWATGDTTPGKRAVLVPSWGTGLDLSYTFVNGVMGDSGTAVAMILDVGWTTRHIRGDLSTRKELRGSILGSPTLDFSGVEVGLTLQYDLLTAGLTYYYFDGQVDGLTGGQIVAGASIQANLASGRYSFW